MDTSTLRLTAIASIAGVALGGAAVYLCFKEALKKTENDNPHNLETRGNRANTESSCSVREFRNDEVLLEQLTRNVQFFGEEAQQRVADAFVVVVGLGGVGSHAAHLLLRSGVGRLRLIDFDQVSLSSLNRHAVATRGDVGTSKARCLEKHFHQIVPEAHLESVVEMFTAENEEELLSGNPDFVIDAIDNLDTKAALIASCKKRNIKVLCVAGAGAKADPTRLRIVDISEAAYDPLARAVRQKLRVDYNLWGEVPVLLSLERPRCKLVSLFDMENGNPLDYQVIPNFRVRTIPVLGTSPAIFGMACASYVLCHLAGQPWESEPVARPQSKEYERLLKELRQRESERFGDLCPPCPLDLDDVIFVTRELWRGFSARNVTRTIPPGGHKAPGGDKGFTRSVANLTLTRWDNSKPPSPDNTVLLSHEEAARHESCSIDELLQKEPEFVGWVERVLDRARREYF